MRFIFLLLLHLIVFHFAVGDKTKEKEPETATGGNFKEVATTAQRKAAEDLELSSVEKLLEEETGIKTLKFDDAKPEEPIERIENIGQSDDKEDLLHSGAVTEITRTAQEDRDEVKRNESITIETSTKPSNSSVTTILRHVESSAFTENLKALESVLGDISGNRDAEQIDKRIVETETLHTRSAGLSSEEVDHEFDDVKPQVNTRSGYSEYYPKGQINHGIYDLLDVGQRASTRSHYGSVDSDSHGWNNRGDGTYYVQPRQLYPDLYNKAYRMHQQIPVVQDSSQYVPDLYKSQRSFIPDIKLSPVVQDSSQYVPDQYQPLRSFPDLTRHQDHQEVNYDYRSMHSNTYPYTPFAKVAEDGSHVHHEKDNFKQVPNYYYPIFRL